MRDSFAGYHPIVNLIYFAFVISFSLVLNHPLAQAISLICAIAYYVSTNGRKGSAFLLKFCLPMVLLTAFVNPAFNHEGVTVLCLLPGGNPLTLESILYGLSAGVMIITLIVWFSLFSAVMTTDKFIYIFGKIIPALSLVLSMSLRFVPKFRAQLKAVSEAKRCLGQDVSQGSLFQRTKIAIHIFSITVTWAFENAIETADSMKSRGYGLRGRSAFSIYKFDARDRYALIWLICCGLFLTVGAMLSAFGFRYFPEIRYAAFDMTTIPFYIALLSLCLTPVLLNFKEERKWKYSASET